METSVHKYLLFDHFAGKSTAMQKRLIEDWLQDPHNQELFYEWLVEWEHHSPQYLPELDQKLEAYIQHMTHSQQAEPIEQPEAIQENTSEPVRSAWRFNRRLLWSATSLFFVLGIAAWLLQDLWLYKTYRTAYNETKTLNLIDGTKVLLNSNSSLKIPVFGFGNRTREVILTGEANFSVKHTLDNQKFIVKTPQDLEVVVLGTEFTVYSRTRGSRVVLKKGKVQLRYQQGNARKEMMMAPGDLVTVNTEGLANVRKTQNPKNHAAWATHRFVFEGTTLQELTHLFEDNFGLKIRIEGEELKKLTLYGSFQAHSAEELLKALTEAANLSYTIQNDSIIVTDSFF